MSNDLQAIGVVGAGTMGIGIAEVCARSGREVVLVEADAERAADGHGRLSSSLAHAVEAGKIERKEADTAQKHIRFTERLEELKDRDLVVEAVTEDTDVKLKVFEALDAIVQAPDAILASNTSSIPIMKLATATRRPEQVIGLHFFNPVPIIKLVELVPSLVTNDATHQRAEEFVKETLKKRAITSKDRAGFIVNALLIPFLLSGIRMVESGFATPEDIDTGFEVGCAHPMGPLSLTDLIGLDTTLAVANSLYDEFKESQYAPPPLLLRMVDAALLGRKTGRGFYAYT